MMCLSCVRAVFGYKKLPNMSDMSHVGVSVPGVVHINVSKLFDTGTSPLMECPCFLGSYIYICSVIDK